MQSLQRAALRSASQLRTQIIRQQRRSDSHNAHNSSHGPATKETIPVSFFVALAALPTTFLILNSTGAGDYDRSYFTRLITDTYNGYSTKWAQRNDVHTQMIEEAAADRVLFLTESSQAVRHVDVRFPEILNTGSPYNVPAGQGGVDLSTLIAKYETEAKEQNEKLMQQLKDNKVPVEQPYQFSKVTPAAVDS